MKIAILSDIHANLEALQAVLAHARDQGCGRLVCLGDVVGYGADPVACLDLLREQPARPAVLGNHDAVAAGLAEPSGFNPSARTAILWTRDRLDGEHRRWLASLPPSATLPGRVQLVHATPDDPLSWRYLLGPSDAADAARATGAALICVGHSHRAAAWRVDGEPPRWCRWPDLVLAEGGRYVVNAGSVGQPRDGDPRAAYLVFDPDRRRVTLHRVPYDIPAAQAKIRRAGLPPVLAERLERGR